jgi:membrane associated rhomboid family serine protease
LHWDSQDKSIYPHGAKHANETLSMIEIGLIGLILIISTVAFSFKGFKNLLFFNHHKFDVGRILVKTDFLRLISSGLLHLNWVHLMVNMVSLLIFSRLLEKEVGGLRFFLIYIGGLLGGNVIALLFHRHQREYTMVGPSGAVCGIIFASIVLFPASGIESFGLPVSIPCWLYGIVFILYSVYGTRSAKAHSGPEALFAGALAGMFIALLLRSASLTQNYPVILILTVPTAVLLYLLFRRPQLFTFNTHFSKKPVQHLQSVNERKEPKESTPMDLDQLLEKISLTGIESLNPTERQRLDRYSNELRDS